MSLTKEISGDTGERSIWKSHQKAEASTLIALKAFLNEPLLNYTTIIMQKEELIKRGWEWQTMFSLEEIRRMLKNGQDSSPSNIITDIGSIKPNYSKIN